jgi:hypothetical protein
MIGANGEHECEGDDEDDDDEEEVELESAKSQLAQTNCAIKS